MMRTVCKSKIHGAWVTEANLNYIGSLTIDSTLMKAANIAPYEWLHVVNVTTGSRFQTYAIEGEAGSGIIALNGAAARLGFAGDKVIIMCSASVTEDELVGFHPHLVFVDEKNHIIKPSVDGREWDLAALEDLGVETEINDAMREASQK
jgi:aspartate 1-decarboxylase